MNRIFPQSRLSVVIHHALVAVAGFACTLPALAGVPIPNTPLQTGSAPPPNIMLTFDDSGSMNWRYIYIHNEDGSDSSNGGNTPIFTAVSDGSGSGNGVVSYNTGDEKAVDNYYGVTGSTRRGPTYGALCDDDCVAPAMVGDYSGQYLVDQSYATNGMYYNPNVTYSAWHYPDGTQPTASTQLATYAAAFQDHNNVNYAWTATGTAGNISITSDTSDLRQTVNTYFVPRTAAADTSDAKKYYRFQILPDGRIWRSDLVSSPTDVAASHNTTLLSQTGVGALKNAFSTTYYSVTVPSGATSLTVTTSGGTGNAAALYVRQGTSNPTTGSYTCRSNTSGTNNQTCTISGPTAGTYKIGVYGNGAAVGGITLTATVPITNAGCDGTKVNSGNYGWGDCQELTPTLKDGSTRSVADEKQNFANWYGFYQTRIKSAKAGLTAAFSSLGSVPRVGFLPIDSSSNNSTSTLYIPVTLDDGLFEDKVAAGAVAAVTNKSLWFKTIVGTQANNGTPLRTALGATGEYYRDQTSGHSGGNGPYGPETDTDQLSCRQNFTILTTDGYWNDSSSPVSGDQDSSAGTTITGTSSDNPDYTFPQGKNYFADSKSGTLADVAMYYWKTDLMPDMPNKIKTTSTQPDPAFWQHMTTFTISIGAKGTLDPATVTDPVTGAIATNTAVAWPTPVHDEVTTIDDLLHAAVDGHGSFVVASDPTAFVTALTDALSSISVATSASSNVAASAARISTGTQLFQSTFVLGKWTGDLQAFPITATGIGSTPDWTASTALPAWGSRKIFTWDTSIATPAGATFPTTAQINTLGNTDVTLGTQIANYIKGDQSLEVSKGVGSFRNRDSILGDMIDSSPVFVPADGSAPATVYVGGNDGMLHAFVDTGTNPGKELFAYVPGGVSLPDLKTLTDPKYIHTYFVDGAIAVSTKDQSKTATDTTGKNILVGVMGRGGKTVFGLDVSDPRNFDATKVLWEFTDTDMGNSLGTPIITRLNTGEPGVIISNGYNSGSGHSVIYVLNLVTGALVKKLDTLAGDTTTNSNGMTTPKGWDSDRNGTIDLIYGGDLLGNLWEFDVSSSDTTLWVPVFGTTAAPKPLFVATDGTKRQPITGGMAIGLNPATFDRWVFFGTGRYITNGDPADKSVQSWYGVIDAGTRVNGTTTNPATDRSMLKQRKFVAYGKSSTNQPLRAFESAAANDMDNKSGWYIDLEDYSTATPAAQGERIVTDSTLLASVLIAASIIPSTDACDPGGTGFINAVDAFTGAALTSSFFNTNGDTTVNGSDKFTAGGNSYVAGSIDLGVGLTSMPAFIEKYLSATGSAGTVGQVLVNNPTNSGRISWREILQGN